MTTQHIPTNPAVHVPSTRAGRPGWIDQAARFFSVGMVNTLLDAGLYFALTRWFGFGARPALAKGISFGAGLINSFYWNKTWTFGVKGRSEWRLFAAFVLTNLVSLAINAAVMVAGLEPLALPEALAWLAATGAAFIWNFIASKFIVFRQSVIIMLYPEDA